MVPSLSPCARIVARLAAVTAVALLASFPGCRKAPRNLPFGQTCNSDRECSSGICLFQSRAAREGRCARRCNMDKDDCPNGMTCTTIAEHAGGTVAVCGTPPPIPLGPGNVPPHPVVPDRRATRSDASP